MLCIIQARMSSRRLKGKVLKKIGNEPILHLIIKRLGRVNIHKKNIIIATSNKSSDKPIITYCRNNNLKFYRGKLNNVASRFFNILKKNKTKYFLRINGDSPFIDPKLINKIIILTKNKNYDIYTNLFPRSFPKGQSIEIISKKIFMKFYSKIKTKAYKEHVTQFFYDNSKLFKIKNFANKKDYSRINMSIDTQSDYYRAIKFASHFKDKNFESLTWNKILKNY